MSADIRDSVSRLTDWRTRQPEHDCTPLALHDDQKPFTCEGCGVYWSLDLNGPDGPMWVREG